MESFLPSPLGLVLIAFVCLLFYIRKKMFGSVAQISEEIVKDKVFLIVTHNATSVIYMVINQLLSKGAAVVLIASNISMDDSNPEVKLQSMSNSRKFTQFRINTLNLESMNYFLKILIKQYARLDCLMFNSMEFLSKVSKDKSTLHPTFNHNCVCFMMLLIKLMPLLDRGDGKIVQIIGDTFKSSKISEKMKNLSFNNRREVDFFKSTLIEQMVDDSETYSDSSFFNLIALKFIRQYSEALFENITCVQLIGGVDYNVFYKYLKTKWAYLLILPFIIPLSYFFVKSPFWMSQPILKVLGERNYYEFLNGGLYDSHVRLKSIIEDAKDINTKTIGLQIIFGQMAKVFEEEEIGTLMKYVGDVKVKGE